MSIEEDIDELIVAAVRGEDADWPLSFGPDHAAKVLARAEYHGVTPILHDAAARLRAWPGELIESLNRWTIAAAFWEHKHRDVMEQAIASLSAKNIVPIVFKGTALAYDLYPKPLWRTRADSDLLVAQSDYEATATILEQLGFVRGSGISGELVSYEVEYTFECPSTGEHPIDLHCRINSSELLSRLLSYDELRAQAREIPALAPGALAPSPIHSLLVACFHRGVHKRVPYYVGDTVYYGGDRLVWLLDIHYLARSFSDEDWSMFLQTAREKGLCAIGLEGLQRAAMILGTECPPAVMEALAATNEAVAGYLDASSLRRSWIDFMAVPSLTGKLRLIRETVFPSRDYMRRKFAASRVRWLPWLYIRRAVAGVASRLRNHS